MNKKEVEKMYYSQNISIRKGIRELDMGIANSGGLQKRSDVNILVVGPEGCGKGSLLKYAYD